MDSGKEFNSFIISDICLYFIQTVVVVEVTTPNPRVRSMKDKIRVYQIKSAYRGPLLDIVDISLLVVTLVNSFFFNLTTTIIKW